MERFLSSAQAAYLKGYTHASHMRERKSVPKRQSYEPRVTGEGEEVVRKSLAGFKRHDEFVKQRERK